VLAPRIALSDKSVFVTWSNPEKIFFSKSSDEGATFSKEIVIYDSSSDSIAIPQPISLVTTQGLSVYVLVYSEYESEASIVFFRSDDQGVSFDEPLILSESELGGPYYAPVLAASSNNGYVYVAWQDKNGTVLENSRDGGRTFGNRVSPFGESCNRNLHMVTENNTIHATCILEGTDTSETELGMRRFHDYKIIVYTQSMDHGLTFSSPVSLTDMDLNFATNSFLSSDGYDVFVAWDDKGNGINLRRSSDKGMTFSNTTLLTNKTDSILGGIGRSDEHAHIIVFSAPPTGKYSEMQDIFIQLVSDNGLSLAAPVNISSDNKESRDPMISIKGNMAYISWLSGEVNLPSNVMVVELPVMEIVK
jgi:hypothetical protein